jgi:hypothetical protein
MNGDRTLTLAPHLQGGKVAFAELVDAFGGQAKAAAETGKGQSRISSYTLRNTPDFAPLDVIDRLEDRTVGQQGWPHVTAWLCQRRGGVFVPLPDSSGPPMPIVTLVSDLVRAVGQLGPALLDLGAAPTAGEAWRRLGDADDVVRIAVQIQRQLQLLASEET